MRRILSILFFLPLLLFPNIIMGSNEFTDRLEELESINSRFLVATPDASRRDSLEAERTEYDRWVALQNTELQAAELSLNSLYSPIDSLDLEVTALDGSLAAKSDSLDAREQDDGPDSDHAQEYDKYLALLARYEDLELARTGLLVQRAEAYLRYSEALLAYNRGIHDFQGLRLQRRRDYSVTWQQFANETNAYAEWVESQGLTGHADAVARLLMDIRASIRDQGESAHRNAALSRVRVLRRQLADYALDTYFSDSSQMIFVEALLGDEPCLLLVDTGANLVAVLPELVAALGWQDRLGEQIELQLADGKKTSGRKLLLPSLEVQGFQETDVDGVVLGTVYPGIDGFLGMSFLNRFNIRIDDSQETPLVLESRVDP